MPELDVPALLDDPRTAAGTVPIANGGAGEDVRDEPDFDRLETEFRKMETDGPTAVNWKSLNEQSLDILQTRSKDLVVASRLAYGLFREEGYKGLAIGLSILRGMVAGHWEGLFPPPRRERGRASSFDWLAEKVAALVETDPPTGEAQVYALIAHDELTAIDDMLSEKLQKFPVALGPLVRALRPHARDARAALEAKADADKTAQASAAAPHGSVQEGAPAATEGQSATQPEAADSSASTQQTAPAAPDTSTSAATSTPEPSAAPPPPSPTAAVSIPAPVIPDVSTSQGAAAALEAVFGGASRVATAIRKEAPNDPRGYLCSRFAQWGPILAIPKSTAGKTELPPPSKDKLGDLEAMQSAGNTLGVLLAAEAAFVSAPFWFDAQFLVCEAMEALGAEFDTARSVVTGEFAAVLGRLPGLTDLTFADGTPFANPATAAWIRRDVLRSDGAGDAGESELDDAKAEAFRLGQAGKVLAGLDRLNTFAAGRRGERDRFLARLEVGEYCLRFDLLPPLFALLDGMRRTTEQRDLGHWEPRLAVSLAGLSWRALAHKNAGRFMDETASLERRNRLMATLAELDIATAARLAGDAR